MYRKDREEVILILQAKSHAATKTLLVAENLSHKRACSSLKALTRSTVSLAILFLWSTLTANLLHAQTTDAGDAITALPKSNVQKLKTSTKKNKPKLENTNQAVGAGAKTLQQDIILDAEFMERSVKAGTSVLRGNVQVIFQGQVLNCDEAIVYWATNTIIATGHIKLQTPTSYLEAESIEANYKTNQATLRNGFVRSGQVMFEGEKITRLSENEYITDGAYYTACTTCPPAWSFKGKSIRAEMGKYAYIKQPQLRIANFPVFWLPYLIVPLKSDRQTGLLVPTIFFTATGGTGLGIPYFWAINKSQDATFTLKHYSLRGTQGLVNYRYVLNPTSSGEFNFGTINDKVFPKFDSDRLGTRKGEPFQRWFLKYKHFYDLPDGFTQTTDLNLVSDLLYPANFPDDIRGGDPALLNRVALTKNSERAHVSIRTDYYINLVKKNVFSGNDDSIHRFPELRYHLVDRRINQAVPILFKFDSTYTNFARNNFSYDDVGPCAVGTDKCVKSETQRDGKYDSKTDLLRTGQRMDLQPQLSFPINASRFFDLIPSVNYRYTQYSFNVQDQSNSSFKADPSRQYLQTRLEFRSTMNSIFQLEDGPKADKFKNQIQTTVVGTTIPYFEQTKDHPFFGPVRNVSATQANQPLSDLDFNSGRGFQFDTYDQVQSQRLVTFGIENRITRKKWAGDLPTYKQVALFKLSQSFDFYEARKTKGGQPWSAISGLVDLRNQYFNTNTIVDYFPYLNVTNISSRMRFSTVKQNYLELGYNSAFIIPSDPQFLSYRTRTENVGVGLGFKTRYIDLGALVDYSRVTNQLNTWSVYNVISPPGNCWLIRSSLQKIPNSRDFNIKLNFEFNFGGEPT